MGLWAAFLIFITPSALSLIMDLWTKSAMFKHFEQSPSSVELISNFLYFTRAHNTGVAFGMLQNQNHILGYIVAIMAIAIPIYTLSQRQDGIIFLISMGMVYGGALGNLYDRWAIGYVRDFIDVRLGSYHYPVFNIADSFICVGVALMLLHNLWIVKTSKG
jgi:signal peptidase II